MLDLVKQNCSDTPLGPNEKFALADFHRGIKASAHLLAELAG